MVLLTFLAGLALVLASSAVVVVRGLRLWRQTKRTGRRLGSELAAFERRAARTERVLAEAEEAGRELEAALERLRRSRARLHVLRAALERSGRRAAWLRAFTPW